MSEEMSPESDQMDISEASEKSSGSTKTLKNEIIDLDRPEKSPTTYKCLSKSSATNSHPLMSSPECESQISDSFVKYEMRVDNFKPQAHSSMANLVTKADIESSSDLELDLPNLSTYNELPDFPDSPTLMKKSLLYDMPLEISPTNDLSDTENDKSIYEAILSPNLQNVSLTMHEKVGNLNFLAQVSRSNKLRKIKVDTASQQREEDHDSDVSSIESISESIKSADVFQEKDHVDMNFIKELLESPDDMEDSILDGTDFLPRDDEDEHTPETIKEYSAEEERRDSRYWQKIELPNGKQRIIDMRVIEPYKRVLSHGGYLQAGGHNAIILFSACYLPDKSRKDYVYVMDNLFLYVLQTLDQLVTEDYVLVYLHGSASSHCMPTIGWLKRCYQLIDRKLRKNLKHLYIVHPTFWLKTIIMMTKPFISSKFYRKIHFINSVQELTNCLPLETAAIPERVINYDKVKFST